MSGWRRLLTVLAMGLSPLFLAGLPAVERTSAPNEIADPQPTNRVRRPPADPPPTVGQVAIYQADQSITVAVKIRGGQTRQTEFRIVGGETKIELLGDAKEVAAGMPVSVWTTVENPKSATRIVIGNSPAPAPGMRRPNNRQPTPNMQASSTVGPAKPLAPLLDIPARTPVPGLSPSAVAGRIDEQIDARLAAENVTAASRCEDSEFIRRVFLDLVGVIPSAGKVAAFLDSTEPDKRDLLIDELLTGSHYGTHFAELWRERILSRDLPTESEPFTRWLADNFNQNRSWKDIVYDVVTAEGQFSLATRGKRLSASDPRALFLLVNTDNNNMQQPRPEWLAAESSRLFLGIQIQCAECHDHPFAAWKQTDFWGLAAFFGQLRSERNQGAGGLSWKEALPPTDPSPRIIIPSTSLRSVGTVVPARLLGESQEYQPRDEQFLRVSFARWMTSADNPYFAKATANWVWAHFFGRGLVNPVDDQHADNPPSHPNLLQLLADEFTHSEFDVKHLIRSICRSQAYQRSSQPPRDGEINAETYAQMAVKVMGPAVLYDSLCQATGLPGLKLGLPERKTKVTTIISLTPREAFVDFFRSAQGVETSPVEYIHGVPQALKLLNAPQLNRVAPTVDQLVKSDLTREEAIEQLYLATLARRPTADEANLMLEFLMKQSDANLLQGYSALLWVLINSSEFVLNY